MVTRPFDRARNVLGDRRGELQEFASRTFKREAMLVISAHGIRTQRRDASAAFYFHRLRPPGARRAVRFRRHPLFDVPAIHCGIFRFLAQLDNFAKQRAGCGIVLGEFAANPREPIPSPYRAIVRLAKTINAAGNLETMRDAFRRIVRFALDLNHLRCGLKSSVFTTNLWSRQSSMTSETFPTWPSTMASCSRASISHVSTVPGAICDGPESSWTPISGAIIGRRMAMPCA